MCFSYSSSAIMPFSMSKSTRAECISSKRSISSNGSRSILAFFMFSTFSKVSLFRHPTLNDCSKLVDHIKQFYGVEVSHVAIYKWIRKYVSMMKKYCDQLVPRVSGIWHSDEMTLNIKDLDSHENLRWAWNVIDNSSRFWLATQITEKREIGDARKVLAQASTISQTRPLAIVTDGLRAYQDAIPKEFFTMK